MANEFKIKNGLLVSGSITGVTESGADNSAKMASTSWVRTYVTANSGAAVRTVQSFTATAGQTTFTISGGYTVGLLDVYLNGYYLNTASYTASNGTTVVLTDAASVDDILDIVIYKSFAGFVTSADQISEGSTNLYYTNARVASYLTANNYATQSYVSTQLAALVASAPATLDTLNELATALGSDPNFATTVTNSIATKLSLSGGTLTGALNGTSAVFSSSVTTTGDIRSNAIYRDYQGEALLQTSGSVTQLGSTGAGTPRSVEIFAGNSTALFINANRNIGFGTINPTVLLDLKKAHGAAYGSLVDLINLNGFFPGYDVDSQRAGIQAGVPPINFGNTSFGQIGFATRGSDGYQTRVRVMPDGLRFAGGASSLSYYEEGSWTPSLRGGDVAGTVGYQFRSATYVRIGNYVFVRWGFKINSISGASGTMQIFGLPFTSVNWGAYQEPNVGVSTGLLATADNAFKARVFVRGLATLLEGRIANNSDTAWNISEFSGDEWVIGEIYYNIV